MSVPVYPMQMGANPYATAGQNGASPYAIASASPSIDATSPYAHDQRFQPPPQAYTPGAPPQGYQRPHSAIGMYSQESPVLEYPGSSGAPSAPLTGQLARQQQQPPLPPSPSIVIASAAKRKRDAKDAREAKKVRPHSASTTRLLTDATGLAASDNDDDDDERSSKLDFIDRASSDSLFYRRDASRCAGLRHQSRACDRALASTTSAARFRRVDGILLSRRRRRTPLCGSAQRESTAFCQRYEQRGGESWIPASS